MRRSQSMYVPSTSQQQVNTVVEDVLLWRGHFHWTAKQNEQVYQRATLGEVWCRILKDGPKISGQGWPSSLMMQMIPKSVINILAQEGFFIDSKSVIVRLQNSDIVESLTSFMQSGHVGCVHIDSELKNLFCPVKLFILHYNGRGYFGVLPVDQAGFVNRLRIIIQQKRNEAIVQRAILSQQITRGNQQEGQQLIRENQHQVQQQQILENQHQGQQQQIQENQHQMQQQVLENQHQMQQQVLENQHQGQQRQILENQPQIQQRQVMESQQGQQQQLRVVEIDSNKENESVNTTVKVTPDSPESLSPENVNQQNDEYQEVEEPNVTTCPASERKVIWTGTLQWLERLPGSLRIENILRHEACRITSQIINGQPKVDGENWPSRLVMQIIPKDILIQICEDGQYEMKLVLFELDDTEIVRSLTLLLKSGFAGCVHFPTEARSKCKIKLLILLYSKELKRFLGFVPTDQVGLVLKIRDVMAKKKEEISSRQAQQYKQIQSERAESAALAKDSSRPIEVITLDDSDISEKTMTGAAEKAIEQLSSGTKNLDGSAHHCTAFRLI